MRWSLIAIAAAAGCGPTPAPPAPSSPYLSAAVRAGAWLQSQQVDGRGAPDRVGDAAASPGLGSGAAGRAVFFGELYAATGDEGFRRSALVEARAALAASDTSGDASLYGGRVGVAFAAAEIAALAEDPLLAAEARRAFDAVAAAAPGKGGSGWGDVHDVLGGAAGVGLGLLYAHRRFGEPAHLAAAVEIGDTLLGAALEPHPGQLRWMRGRAQPFDLPNFSHGTAGVGFFLTELAVASGLPRFAAAGAAAEAYLDAIARTTGGVYLVPYGVPNDGYATPFDIGWAHGPAGTARLHHAAWRARGDAASRARMEGGARSLLASGVPGASTDTSTWRGPFPIDRRFGTAGAASFLFDVGRVTGERSFVDCGFAVVDALIASATADEDGDRWVVPLYGFQRGEGDAVFTGYFYGSAGIGLALLHAHHASRGGRPRIRLPDDPFR